MSRDRSTWNISRRGLLGSALLGSGALATGLLGTAALVSRARAGTGRNLLVWWNAGGWDTTYAFDPHFDDGIDNDPDSAPATTSGIPWADAESRPSLRAFFERYASRSVVVNGVSVGSISHDGCTRLMLTGDRADSATDVAAMVAADAPSLAVPCAVLTGPRYPGAVGSLVSDANATFAGILRDELPEGGALAPTDEDAVQAWLATEGDRLLATRERPRLRAWRDGLDRLASVRAEAAALPADSDPGIDARIALAVTLLDRGLSRSVLLTAPARTAPRGTPTPTTTSSSPWPGRTASPTSSTSSTRSAPRPAPRARSSTTRS